MIQKVFKLLIVLVLTTFNAYSQVLQPPIQNYEPALYDAASQNWDIAVDNRGVVYSANNQGLLEFDGLSWQLHKLESGSIIRSVLPHRDRIYTGSFREFGYWELDEKGELIYNSLRSLMSSFELRSDEFWEIKELNDKIFFRSFGGLFKYENNEIEKLQNVISTAIEVFDDRLIMAERGKGLSVILENGERQPLEGDLSALDQLNIVELHADKNNLYIGSKNELYIYSDGVLTRIQNPELNQFIAEFELNHILTTTQNKLLVGTIKNGVVEFDLRTEELNFYNRVEGLQNNTILGMEYHHGNLWLALDRGIDYMDLDSPVKYYTDHSGQLGAVYDIENFNDDIYLASNTGVHTFSDEKLKIIEGSQDHVWNLETLDDRLFVNHNTGIYEIKNDIFQAIEKRTGSYVIEKVPNTNEKYVIGQYTGISLYDGKSGEVEELQEIRFPVKQIVFENENVLWAAHPYEGLYRITHNNFKEFEIQKIPPLGKTENYRPKLFKLNGQVICFVASGWYRYNPFNKQFEEFEEFKDLKNYKLLQKTDKLFVFANEESGKIIFTDLAGGKFELSAEDLNNRIVKTNENIVRANDSIFLIPLNDGYAELNFNQFSNKNKSSWISKPFFREFRDNNSKYKLSEIPELKYKSSGNIHVKVGAPISDLNDLRYELKGEEKASGRVGNNGWINFKNLPYGDYELFVGNGNLNDLKNGVINYKFSIAPPWYFSNWMKAAYILFAVILGLLIVFINRRKLHKHQIKIEEKFEAEHQEKLAKIEHDRLVNEIDAKRKELANTTMMAAKKNEVLMEIQNELSKDKNSFSNQYRMKHIMNKINSAVKSKDEWKVFETNFNEVHEDFFKVLLEKYPKLSSKDLKLCSYLKMNLSSKEIAPLMGISVRGVEVHRYRLRKKMKLESDVNLTKFLIKNF